MKKILKQVSKLLVLDSVKSNEELIAKVKLGNKGAFEVLYERYKNPIFGYIFSVCKDEFIARELAQDTFLKVYKNSMQFEEGHKFTTWLWRIARNTTIDYLKKRDALRYTVDLRDDDGEVISVEELDKELTTPEILLIEKSLKEDIENCLSKLGDNLRDVLLLRIKSELSYQEIAEVAKISVAAVKSKINRAKGMMIKCIELKERRSFE